ncbi:PREDICTED: leukocyte surface antigen CD53 [Nanorana parkeri]|uniref:leukocyte surface antigen CD53 n=1 Tax=Nanorana parkeri TaxID=125878 RepID=UPI0008547B16|nr:PREDICTED: leukocyte surface antigen CD53 [Nanorana parkeri]
MSKCIRVLKYMLFAFNLLFWAIGCSIIAIGIYFVVHNIYGSLFPDIPSLTTGNILIIFGCVIMVFGFVGCMGAIKENKCLLLTFFILLLLILLTEVILAIVLFVYEKQIGPYITNELKISLEKHKEKNLNETIWDNIQSSMKCCGINSSKDWGDSVPSSCCPEETKDCNNRIAFKRGCSDALTSWFEHNFLYVGVVTICTSVIEVLGMSFALTLYCHISKSSGSLNTK